MVDSSGSSYWEEGAALEEWDPEELDPGEESGVRSGVEIHTCDLVRGLDQEGPALAANLEPMLAVLRIPFPLV